MVIQSLMSEGFEPLVHRHLPDCGDYAPSFNIKTRHRQAKKYTWCFDKCQISSLFLCVKANLSEGHISDLSAAGSLRARRYINWP